MVEKRNRPQTREKKNLATDLFQKIKDHKYIGKEGLKALLEYKYRSCDKSYLSYYVLQPFWNYSIRFVPIWLAPNLVTLIGMVPLTLAFIWTIFVCPTMNCASANPWLFYLAGLGLFWYQTLDNLDGRQARRTGTSSPLGQLFDHGVDSVVISIAGITASAASSLGPTVTFLQVWTGAITFWFATWEEYHTGVLTLGYINGPTEGILIVVGMLLSTGFYGPSSWLVLVKDYPIFQSLGIANTLFGDWTIGTFTMFCCAAPCYSTCLTNVNTVVRHLIAEKKPLGPAFLQLGTYFSLMGVSLFWWFSQYDLWVQYPYFFQFTIALAFAELTSRLILAHLCHLPYEFFQRPLVVVCIGAFGSVFVRSPYFGFAVLALISVLFAHYCRGVIVEICAFLKIRPLTIPVKKD